MAEGSKKQRHRKDKPWDHEGIDHWAPITVTKDAHAGVMIEESSFSVLFPRYREKYLQEVWPAVAKALKEQGIKGELNLVDGTMSVKTTRKAWDPYIIVKARDLLKLLARSIPAPQALKILQDETVCDIIKISGFTRSKEKFKKRRQRLIGSAGSTLKALELLTGCYILVQGNTVAAMGPYKGLKLVRRIAEDCMQNRHPIYHIKILMVKRELAKDPTMASENWDRFLPKFKKKNVKRHKPRVIREKQPYTPFPPPQQPSKIDLQLESGEYFLTEEQKRSKARTQKKEKMAEKTIERKMEKWKEFEPVKERSKNLGEAAEGMDELVTSLKQKSGKVPKRKHEGGEEGPDDVTAYLATPSKVSKKRKNKGGELNNGPMSLDVGKNQQNSVGIEKREKKSKKRRKSV